LLSIALRLLASTVIEIKNIYTILIN